MKDFKIHYLDSEEFDNLPYKKIKTSGGVTDMKKKEIYIRHFGSKDIEDVIKQHEIMESKLKESPDEPENEEGV